MTGPNPPSGSPPKQVPSDPPEAPTATAWRVRVIVQLVGVGIAGTHGIILPLLGVPFSVPLAVLGAGMAGVVAPAISFDAKRRAKEQDSDS